jgi:hypothetical protein
MKNKKKANKKIGKVNPLLYSVIYRFFKRKYTKKYHITFDKEIVKEIKGPAIVVATHTCDMDHILSALTLYPIRPTYIVSEHFMRNKSTARLMKMMHVITKKMFTPDVSTIKNILRVKKEKGVILIFPEGRLSCYGRTLPVTDGTADLVKKLGVDLYAWKAEGAYCTFPKWREKGEDRIGKIHCSVQRLLTAEEVESYHEYCKKIFIEERIFLHPEWLLFSCEEWEDKERFLTENLGVDFFVQAHKDSLSLLPNEVLKCKAFKTVLSKKYKIKRF